MEIMRLKGTNGTVIAYDDRVVIERTGLFAFAAQGFKGSKTYFYKDLSSVGYKKYKKPGMANGYLQFIVAGSNPSAPKSDLWGTSKETMQDENVVVLRAFNSETPVLSDKIYRIIMDHVAAAKHSNSGTAPASVSGADEIRKYNKLYKQGIITEAEFTAKKKQILGI